MSTRIETIDQSDLAHPDRTTTCNARHASEHQFCGGYIVSDEADVDCACHCHQSGAEAEPDPRLTLAA